MTAERFALPVGESARVDAVPALFEEAADPPSGFAFLLAHGAGANMESGFMERVARLLAANGHAVMRFDYPYQERARREGKRRPPDRRAVLEDVHRRALAALRERAGERRLVLAGKSMGGRIASHLAAEGADAAGLVFLGYPLHAPGRPDAQRAEHFAAIAQPALFLQGTRDKLCELPLLRRALGRWGGPATVVEIEGGDHGFEVPKKLGGSGAPPYERLAGAVEAWLRELG